MSLKIAKLFVEYQEQPLGLDEAVPRFSWLLTSTKQNVLYRRIHRHFLRRVLAYPLHFLSGECNRVG